MLAIHFIYEASNSNEDSRLNQLAKFLYSFYGFDTKPNNFSINEIFATLKQFSCICTPGINNVSEYMLSTYKSHQETIKTTIFPICSVDDEYTSEAFKIVSTGLIKELESKKDMQFIAYVSEPPVYFTQEEFNSIFHNGLKNVR